jgi:hypothetical protein
LNRRAHFSSYLADPAQCRDQLSPGSWSKIQYLTLRCPNWKVDR